MKLENKIKKFLETSLLVGALSLPLKNTQACDDPIPFDVFIRYESNLINSVRNVPFEIRDVPKHPDDWYETSPIIEDNIKLTNPFVFKLKFDKRIFAYKNFGLNLGTNFNIYHVRKNNLRTREYGTNYKVAKPSCEDIPLTEKTYYNVEPAFFSKNNKWFNPSIFLEIETPINEKMNLALGYELSHQKFIAENGWKDSDNKLEDNKRYNLMDLIVGEPYASLKYHASKDVNLFLDFGLRHIINKEIRGLGREMDIKFNDKNWFVGIGIGQEY